MLRALYVDFNSYFCFGRAAVGPELRGRPVAVVLMIADTTCAIVASIEAKRFGVKTLTNVRRRRLCPEIVLVESRPTVYVRIPPRRRRPWWRASRRSLPSIPSTMWIRLSGRGPAAPGRWKGLAREIKYRLRQQLGECITCSVGIAPNTFLCQDRERHGEPDGLVVIEPSDLPDAEAATAQSLCRHRPQMPAAAQRSWYHQHPQLLAADVAKLREVWGGVEGERFWQNRAARTMQRGDQHLVDQPLA